MNNQFDKPVKWISRSAALLVLLLLLCFLVFPDSVVGQVQPQPVWTNTIGSAGSPKAIVLDPSGNVIVAGYDAGDYLTAKFAPNGNLLWSARQSGRVGDLVAPPGITSIALDEGGNVYVTGGLGGSRAYNTTICFFNCVTFHVIASDQVTIKYNSNGQRQWVASYSEKGDSSFSGMAIAIDKGGNVYVTGTVTIKYDASGHEIWSRTNVSASSLVLDTSTNIYLGTTTSTRKFDKDGALLWTQPINGSVLKSDADGNLYATGTIDPGPTTKFDSGGAIIWTAPFGGQLDLESAGSVFLARPFTGIPYPHIATVKLNSQGGLVWQAINDHGYYNGVSVSAVATDSSGNVYVAGQDNGTIAAVKYNADGIRVWEAGFAGLLALDSSANLYVASGSGGFVLTRYVQAAAPGAPVIASPPLHPLVRPGDNVTLNVSATGTPTLSYQWRTVQGIILDGTNASLPLMNVQASQAGMYSVEVTNELGSAASPEIYLSVLNQLLSQTVVLGATAVFKVPLSGGGPAGYQWRFNGTNLPGQTGATLAVTNVGPNQVGDYVVVVSNYYGNVLTSTVAQLSLDTHVTQAWAATVPGGNVGDVAQAVGVDAAGNVFVTGYSGCGHKTVKYNPAGQELWERCDTNYATLAGLAVDASGNVCVAGGSILTKYAATGTLLWSSHFDDGKGSSNNLATGIAADSSGNFYVTGSTRGTNGVGILSAKYHPNGQQEWATLYPGTPDDFSSEVLVDGAGNVYACGAVVTSSAYDFIAIKYDANGGQVWAKIYDGPSNGNDIASHAAVDSAGSVYLTGWSSGDDYITDFSTIKYDASGAPLWVARYQGPGNGEDNPHGLGVDANGNVYVTGSSVGTNGLYDIATVKYAPDGAQLWVRRYSGPANRNDYSRALALDAAGNVYIEGHSDTGPGSSASAPATEVVTLSYDNSGNERWAGRYETGVESGAYYRNGSLKVASAGAVYVADTTFVGGTAAYLTLKYVQRSSFPARLAVPVISFTGQLRCGVSGEPGTQYTIQVSGDLMNWISLTSVVANATGTNEFTDTAAPGSARRFYRTIQP